MYQALNETVVHKKVKIPQKEDKPLNTINVNDLNNMDLQPTFPPSFDLLPFEDEENDDYLLQYLKENPGEEYNKPPEVPKQVVNTTNTMSTTMPIVPKMLFQNSNVTMNNNFGK